MTLLDRVMTALFAPERMESSVREAKLQARINDLEELREAMRLEHTAAIRNALAFEGLDLGDSAVVTEIRIKELESRNKAMEKRLTKAVDSEANAWRTCDAVLLAWESAAGLRADARWDKEKKEWVIDQKDPTLPPDVLEALNKWVNRSRPK
jgi:hypothetical protein